MRPRSSWIFLAVAAITVPGGLHAQHTGSLTVGHSFASPGVAGSEVRAGWGLTDRLDVTLEAWKGELQVSCIGLGAQPCADRSWAGGLGLERAFTDPGAPGWIYARAAAGFGRMNDGGQGGYLLGGLGLRLRIGEYLQASLEARAHGVAVEWMGIGAAVGLGVRF